MKLRESHAINASAENCQHIIKIGADYFKVDILELPFTDINSPEAVEQLEHAIAITEAAVLVYDVDDLSSLTYLKSLSNAFYESLHHTEAMVTKKKTPFPFTMSRTTTTVSVSNRPYNFILLGNQNDVSAAKRDVSWVEGHKAASEFFGPNGVASATSAEFLECSSRTGERVDAIFPLLGREIMRTRHEACEREQKQRRLREEQEQERYAEQLRRQQQHMWRPRSGTRGVGIGACDDWGCGDFGFDDYVDVDDDRDFESLVDNGANNGSCDEGSSEGTATTLAGSMRRRWSALKATFSTSFFKKSAE